MSTASLFRIARRLVALGALAAPLAAVHAQGVGTFATVGASIAAEGSPSDCITVVRHLPTASLDCTYGGGETSIQLLSGPVFHARAYTTATNRRAEAIATVVDRIYFYGTLPFALTFDFYLHGTVSGSRSYAEVDFSDTNLSEPGVGFGFDQHATTDHATWSYTVEREGELYSQLDFAVSLRAFAYDNTDDTDATGSAAYADLGNTAYITGITAYDATGAKITNGLSFSSASGMQYQIADATFVPSVTTPEPASLALLGAGALPLGALAARRRRAVSAR